MIFYDELTLEPCFTGYTEQLNLTQNSPIKYALQMSSQFNHQSES